MTPTTTATPAADTTAPASWSDYLDAVEAAVLDVQACLIEGRTPQMPVLTLPAGPPPVGATSRRETVATLLAEVTTLLQSHRDSVGERLAGLPSRRRPGAGYHTVAAGGQFDVTG